MKGAMSVVGIRMNTRLSTLAAAAGLALPAGALDAEVTALAYDSRRAGPGALFFALPGVKADGAAFAADAVARGAVAVVSQTPLALLGAPVLVAKDARRALGLASATFYRTPSRRLKLAGVTGTNGKTTTTYLVEAMAREAGLIAGVMGTVEYRFAGRSTPAPHTTPEAPELQSRLADMADAGVQLACIEVSSHALAQSRVDGCEFAAAAFTNLTRDHLDYHGSMEAYFEAKARLFRELVLPGAPATVNVDDAWGERLAEGLKRAGRKVWRASSAPMPPDGCELVARVEERGLHGTRGAVKTPFGSAPFSLRLVGAHNVENFLTAAGLALGAGVPLDAVLRGAASLDGVPGRLQRVPDDKDRAVFVDYAHTDDALSRVLTAVRALGPGRLVCVFGCGGDRDRGKRPLMGAVAARLADVVVVTSDNPRSEDPLAILAEIVPGLEAEGKARVTLAEAREQPGFVVEPDRAAAIRAAIALARRGDAVLLAGKGHEDYQLVGAEKLHFDDREEAARALKETPA